MSEVTYSRRLSQLIEQLRNHPNREEIIALAQSQIIDDVNTVDSCLANF